MSQNTSKTIRRENKSGCICHRCIVLIITTGRVMELETLQEINLVLLYMDINGVNLLLHCRDGLLHG
jgi:hypothetical protein